MVGTIAVKLICLANQLELPFLARPLRPIARRAALKRSVDCRDTADIFVSLPIELQAKIVREVENKDRVKRGRLPRFKSYTTSLENQAMRLIEAINRCGKRLQSEAATLEMEK